MVIFATRKEGTSHEECIEYMEEEHAPLVEELPGLQKYTSSVPLDPASAGVDYVAQLWFDDPEAMDAAFESETGREVTADAENFLDTDALRMVAVGEETTHVE
ncbi:EthD family reductase [Halostella sp. JP-L12]|nr:EthD family reductase [Halostella sp. JP-L12]